MSDETDETGKVMATVMVAALLLSNSDAWADHSIERSFKIAERFVQMAEARYGPITD